MPLARLSRVPFSLPFCLVALALGLAACSGRPPAPNATHPVDPPDLTDLPMTDRDDRVVKVLPNRMVLVAQRVPTAPVVSAHVWVKTGSLYEQEHVGAGLSHFLEHLLSGGTTTTRPEAESNATLARIGAQTNAATSLDTVRYFINTTAEHTDTAIDLLSDWMQNNVVLQSEYEREREVIQREFSMGRGDPARIFWKLTQRARFAGTPDHPGAHPTIGYLDEFLAISRDELDAFYRRMYVPNNMVFVVAGDIDPPAVIDRLTELWQDVPTGELPDLSFPIEPESAPVTRVEGYADIAQPRARVLWRGVELASEHDFALDLLASILGQGESSRLVRSVRQDQQLVTSIDAFNYSTTWGPGFFGIDFQPAEGVTLEQAADAALVELDRMRTQPVSDEELARAKRKVLAGVLSSGQSSQAIASRLASDLIGMGDPDYLRRYADAVQSLTAQDLMAAADAVLPPGGHSTVVLEPADGDHPVSTLDRPADDLAVNPDAASRPFDLDNRRLIRELHAALANPAGAAQPITLGDPVVETLDNGLTVVAQRSTVVPAVAMQLYTLGGLLSDPPGQEGTSNAAQAMLNRGAAGWSAEQIAAALENLGATLGTGGGNNTSYVTATALSEDWEAVLAVMADVVLRPDFPEDEWNKLRPRLLAAIDQEDDRWSGELRRVFREAYFGDHPWSQTMLGRRETVESATAASLRDAYFRDLRASDSVLAVVGDIDPTQAVAAVKRRFSEMPKGTGDLTPPQPTPPSPRLIVEATDKPVTAVQIGYGPGITRDHPDYAALRVLTRVISAFPSGWLDQALRGEGPGLVYAVSAGNVTGVVPGYFSVIFNTTAQTATEATTRAAAVIERARTQPVSPEKLEAAKTKVIADEFLAKQSNADLATTTALDRLYGVDDPGNAKFLEEVRAMTAERLLEVAQRYLKDPVAVVITQDPVDEAELEAVLFKPADAE